MEQLQPVLDYFRANPQHAVGLVILVVIAYFALNYRPKMHRQAEQRFNQLREERGDLYRGLRPPR